MRPLYVAAKPYALVASALTAWVAAALLAEPASGARAYNASIEERARGAGSVVVGRVLRARSEYQDNERGDRLIVTHYQVLVRERLKGAGADVSEFTVEGGKVGGVTLTVSDLPVLREGEDVVLFLDRTSRGLRPHRRGLGILRLERAGEGYRVRNSGLTVEMIRGKIGTAR